MAKVQLKSTKQINKTVSRLPGVRRAVDDAAEDIKQKAETNLARHRKSGDAHIEIEKAGVDAIVALVASETGEGEAPLSIEFGNGRSQGLYVLSRAAGLL